MTILAVPLMLAPMMLGALMKGLNQNNSNSKSKEHHHHDHNKKVHGGDDAAKGSMQVNTQVNFSQANTSSSSRVNFG